MSQLIQSSLQPSSVPTYKRAWQLFTEFHHSILGSAAFSLPITPPVLALFIAHMFNKGYASSTVNTYLSTLGYSHRLLNFPDPTKVFYITQMLKGYGKLDHRLDVRLPITLPILHKIVSACQNFSLSHYEVLLYQTMCLLAFHAYLRVGEITSGNPKAATNIIQLSQLARSTDHSNPPCYSLTFYKYKHCTNQRPFTLTISRKNQYCPVEYLQRFLAARGNRPGPLFVTPAHQSVTREQFCTHLRSLLRACGLDPARYKGHSFRIGAASHAASVGLSDSQIRILGRWKSNAFLKYIRVTAL